MTDIQLTPNINDEAYDEDIEAVYGKKSVETADLAELAHLRNDFAPWHHPVKQIVRQRQWAALTEKLIKDRPQGAPITLKYFTLPGADLLDIKVLADICAPLDIKIEYFGFNSGNSTADTLTQEASTPRQHPQGAAWVMAESALRQAGRITENAIILEDRLEDIAIPDSQAAIQLQQRTTFDVINIDACDHLAYYPRGRSKSTFDAMEALLRHQTGAPSPWLLFLTTRVNPQLLGNPGIVFQNAITQNLSVPNSGFGASLAECINANLAKLATELSAAWGTNDERFLKLYSIGLGKFLLQFFHGQPSLPANVELSSIYAYRVNSEEPDMLALAFLITPDAKRVFAPQVGGVVTFPNLEPLRAVKLAKQAMQLKDIDKFLEIEYIKNEAVNGTKKLLDSARYDLTKWKEWLANHKRGPLSIT